MSDNETPTLRDRVLAEKSMMTLDLWMALGGDSQEGFAYMDRNGFATTWAELLELVNVKPYCGKPIDGGATVADWCVLREHSVGPCHGSDDVGRAETLPIPPGRRSSLMF